MTTFRLTIGAVVVVSVLTAIGCYRPEITVMIVAAVFLGLGLVRLGTWRALFAIAVTALLLSTSNQPALQVIGFYPRYLAAVMLAAYTWFHHREQAVTVKDLSPAERNVVTGMYLAAGTGAASILWSVDRFVTGLQAAALITLAVTVHALVCRRWRSPSLIPGDLTLAFWGLTICTTLSAAAGLAGKPDTETEAGRLRGVVANPNMLAVLCLLAVPLAWFLYQQTRRRIFLVAMAPSVVSVVMTETRSAILGLAVGAAWVAGRRGLGNLSRIGVAVGVAAGLVWLAQLDDDLMSSRLYTSVVGRFGNESGEDPLSGRSLAWKETVNVIKARPATGYGYSAGPSLFEQLRGAGQLQFELGTSHNSYLQWLLDTGILGAPALIVLLFACARVIRGALGHTPSAGLGWCIAGGLVVQFTEAVMFGTGQIYPLMFWLVVAAGAVLSAQPLVTTSGTKASSARQKAMLR